MIHPAESGCGRSSWRNPDSDPDQHTIVPVSLLSVTSMCHIRVSPIIQELTTKTLYSNNVTWHAQFELNIQERFIM